MTDVSERTKNRTQLVEEAISAALDADWARALELNQAIAERFGSDEEVNNRTGKVLAELGRFDEALASYRSTLEMNPLNGIAIKNVNRLEALISEKAVAPQSKSAVDVNLFVEEMGKTTLATVTPVKGLDFALVAPGEVVELRPDGDSLKALTASGVEIGTVESKIARRVLKFLAGGNLYAGGVATVEGHTIRLIIRETYQATEFAGVPSFPVRKGQEFRAYAKDSLLRDGDMEGLGDDDDDAEANGDGDEELDGMHAVEPGNEDAADYGDDDSRGDDNY
ncbi:MAG: tetratricopeptide repeat protein [Candidatus Dormibacteria bacterium]